MAKIVFSPEARKDLIEIGDYIALKLRNRSAAQQLMARIQEMVLSLGQFPKSGTPVSFSAPSIVYRYLICGSYMIFYHLTENRVQIDRVLYGRRDYLSVLFGDQFTEDTEA